METFNHYVWNIDPIMLQIGFIKVRWYGVLFATGLALGYYLLKKVFIKENQPVDKLDILLLYFIVGTIFGARLGHVFFYDWNYYSQHLSEIWKIYNGGLASHGAIVGILLATGLFIHFHYKGRFFWLLDRMAIFIPLGGALIRVGNFFNSEILGHASNVPWAIIFARIDNIPRHPAQLYEAIAYFKIFAILYYLYRNTNIKLRPLELTGWFFSLTFGFRIFVEFFKEEQSDALSSSAWLDMGQWLSIPVVILGIGLIIIARMGLTKAFLPENNSENNSENNQINLN
jgi:prolipoprotein diacylglyceryl transferase